MGLKEKMMENMMNGMSEEEKKEMMDKMMDGFFSGMTDEEKGKMMEDMMKKMTGGGGMMNMMGMMMGKSGGDGFNPMDMCKKMMEGMNRNSEIATFATPEVRGLFEDWVSQIDEEILEFIKGKKSIDPDEIAKHLKISKKSAIYFLSKLAQKGKITIKAEEGGGNQNDSEE